MSSDVESDNEKSRSQASKNLSALLHELEEQYPSDESFSSHQNTNKDPYFVPETQESMHDRSLSCGTQAISDTLNSDLDKSPNLSLQSADNEDKKGADKTLDYSLMIDQELSRQKSPNTSKDDDELKDFGNNVTCSTPKHSLRESVLGIKSQPDQRNISFANLVPEDDEDGRKVIDSQDSNVSMDGAANRNPTPDLGSHTSTPNRPKLSKLDKRPNKSQVLSTVSTRHSQRSISLLKHLSSSSVKKRRKKIENCKFCTRYVTKDQMENHLNTFETCKLLHYRDLKCKSVTEVLVKLWKCFGCDKTGNFYLRTHLKANKKCCDTYRRMLGVNTLDEVTKKLKNVFRQSYLSRQSTQRNLEYNEKVSRQKNEKTISDSINKFRQSTEFSNYRVCVQCENHHLESYTVEIDPKQFGHLNLMNKKHLRRGHKFFMCKFCSSLNERFQTEESITILHTLEENGSHIYFPKNSREEVYRTESVDQNSLVFIPSSVQCLEATDLSNLKLPTHVSNILYSCKPITNNSLSTLYLHQIRKFKEVRTFDRYVGWIENVDRRLLSNVKQILNDADIRSSESYHQSYRNGISCRFDQNGPECIVISIGINIQDEQTLATMILNQDLVVTVEYVGDENFVLDRKYFVHNHDASVDCDSKCTKQEMSGWIQENNYMAEGIKVEHLPTYISSVYLKTHHFVEEFVKAEAFEIHSKEYTFNISFKDGEIRIEGLLWPEFCLSYNQALSKKSLNGEEFDEDEFIDSVSKSILTISSVDDLMNTLDLSRKEAEELHELVMKHQVHLKDFGSCDCSLCTNPPLPSLVSLLAKRPKGEAFTNIYNSTELLNFMQRLLKGVNVHHRTVTKTKDFLEGMFRHFFKAIPDSSQETIQVQFESKQCCFVVDTALKTFIKNFGLMSGIYHYALQCSEEENTMILQRDCIIQCFTQPYVPSILEAFRQPIEVQVLNKFTDWDKFQDKFISKVQISSNEIEHLSNSHHIGSVLELLAYSDSRKINQINSTPIVWVDTSNHPNQRFKKVLEESETTYKLDDKEVFFEPEYSNRLRHHLRLNGVNVLLSEYVVYYDFMGASQSQPIYQIYENNLDKIANSEIRSIFDESEYLPIYILSSNGHVARIRKTKKVLHTSKFIEESEEYRYSKVLLFANIKPGEEIDQDNLSKFSFYYVYMILIIDF